MVIQGNPNLQEYPQLPGDLASRITAATPLSGGLSNRCWKLTDISGNQFVWRPVSKASGCFGVNREHEWAVQKIASRAGLAPDPVTLYAEGLLIEWVEGQVCEPDTVGQEDVLSLLGKVHKLALPSPVFNLKSRCRHYWENLPEKSKPPALTSLHQRMQSAAEPIPSFTALCHHDFGFYNFIREPGDAIRVIDWEYAAAGDACLDLALCAFANGYDVEDAVLNYCRINNVKSEKEWIETAQNWIPFVQYMGILWYLLGDSLYGGTLYKARANLLMDELGRV